MRESVFVLTWGKRNQTLGTPGIRRAAVSMLLVIIIFLILVAAALGGYFLLGTSGGSNSTHASSSGQSSSSVTGTVTTYHGTYTFTMPEGPYGIGTVNGSTLEYNSTVTATGSFTFSVNSLSYNGTGSGRGNITVATRGYCSGSNTVPYTFTVTGYQLPGENLTAAFNLPTPENVSVALTCHGSTEDFNGVDNPTAFLSVYPNLVEAASVPATISQVLTGGISYTITIEESS
jgi:hypothetical protein